MAAPTISSKSASSTVITRLLSASSCPGSSNGRHRLLAVTAIASRPNAAELAAARGRTIPDVVAPGLRVLFAGINPSLYSAATGWHFARPGNRFWPTLHSAGFTARQLRPDEQHSLLAFGLGITNVVARATARADELTPAELQAGGAALASMAAELRASWLAVLGVTAYRAAYGAPSAVIGAQPERLGGVRVWVLPNPSGLNAHYSAAALAAEFERLRHAAASPPVSRASGA
ncbi:MAG: G/U mismatch-specific DNA glycosylase [Actinobacteria bacterium]|nr:G/U mismatch-specific DNA glycosylase [Actinomycetota bacterium]